MIHAPTFEGKSQDAREIRDKFLPFFYRQIAFEGRFVFVEGAHECSRWLQLSEVDTVCTSAKTLKTLYIEEKIDWHRPRNFCLETISNTVTVPQRDGWMKTAKSEYLLYAFVYLPEVLDVYWLNFPRLREWFWQSYTRFEAHTMPDTSNRTASRLVPVNTVIQAVPTSRYSVYADGTIRRIPLLGSLEVPLSLQAREVTA